MVHANLAAGTKARVAGFAVGNRPYKQKLLAMGIVPGVEFIIKRLSPVNDIMEIMLDNFCIILRQSEAAIIKITKVDM